MGNDENKKKERSAARCECVVVYHREEFCVAVVFLSVIIENQLFHFVGVNASAYFLALLKMFPALICKHDRGARRRRRRWRWRGFKHAAGVTCSNSIAELWHPLGCRYGADKRLYETLRGCLGGGRREGRWERGSAGNVACCRRREAAERS